MSKKYQYIWRLCACILAATPLILAFQNFRNAPSADTIEVEGEVEVMIEDHAQSSKIKYYLKTKKNEQFELLLSHADNRLQTGAKVKVRGKKQQETSLALDLTSSGSVTVVTAPPLQNTFGDHKMAILLVNFLDNLTQPYTLPDANTALSQVDAFMKENSLNQTWVTGNSFGWFTLPMNASCDYSTTIRSAALQAAQNAGVDLSVYQHIAIVFPRNTACPWAGIASISGKYITINGNIQLKVFGHEFGHNLGLYHAHSLDCAANVNTGTCVTNDYGDTMDIMGNSNAGHLSAFQKELLGWLNYSNMPTITNVTSAGDYIISPYEEDSIRPKALKIYKGLDAATGLKSYYYVEFRQALGLDAFLSSWTGSGITSGVVIRTGVENTRNSSFLLDMTPESNSPYYDWRDIALAVGQSYVDNTASISIKTKSVNSSGAEVTVSLSAAPVAPCVKANPIITPSSQTKSGLAGSAISYSVSVTNQDSSACAASSFSLSRSLPAGWIATLSPSSLSLSPGGSASVTMTVTSSASATGNNNIIVNAISGSYSGSATAIYSVTAPAPVCTKANPIITPSSQTKSGLAGSAISYSVSVKNQDSSACAASSFSLSRSLPAGWIATLSPSSLSLSPGGSASVTMTVTSSASATGNNNIVVNAISGSYSGSATAIYSVTAPPVTSLTVTASTDKSVYLSGQIVLASAKVLSGSTAVVNASVSFQVIDPRGKITTYNVISDASGVAKISYSLIAKSPKGVYQIKVNANSQSLSGSASVNFTKQ